MATILSSAVASDVSTGALGDSTASDFTSTFSVLLSVTGADSIFSVGANVEHEMYDKTYVLLIITKLCASE